MNKLFSLLMILLLGCSASTDGRPASQATDNDIISPLSVEGIQLVDDQGNPIMLRGVSFGWHNWWPRFYNAGVVKWLKEDWKANVVRAAMGVEPEGAYLDNPDWSINKVEAVVEAAIEAEVYVIIDWHSHHIHLEEAKDFFKKMATKYGNHPNVIYEIYNEPESDTWQEVKAYSEEVIKVIREIDPDNLILVGSPHWGQDVHLAADDPIVGYDNIMYTLHFYAATHKDFLRKRADYALGKGLPLFVSECASMEATGDGEINQESWQAWYDWMEENQISWLAWSISDKDETCSMLHPSASSAGKWQAGDLKEWAKLVKTYLNR
ncbi:glycoside hydrolase family 5 protein [Echinicola strongylocentroti]|uniref:Glycoside hydrolase family 5 protein n=1 Tax=Echinicola strongylocentroti TaxID=1795355 RepID=A0A2Z4IJ66_9BACT|nr:glycoside hydrolase family 5 protein [Echinicola strongylocentroti]AWW31171.1 glycoside hydrolase family 5 protein [Echinicola strongylocentroti]